MADVAPPPAMSKSQEEVALALLDKVIASEHPASVPDRQWLLRTYAECLITIQNPHIKWKP